MTSPEHDIADTGPAFVPGPGRWLGRIFPVVLAVFTVVGTFGSARNEPELRHIDVIAVVLAVAAPLSLLLLRRHTVAVLVFVSAATLTFLLRDYPYGPIIFSLGVAMFANVLFGRRVAAWACATVVVVAFLALSPHFRDEPASWGKTLGVTAWALLILIAGDVGRGRRERMIEARRARAEARRRQANEERLRIARELHDTVAHHMSLINVQASTALHLLDRQPEQAESALAAIKDASREGLQELRALVGVLREEAGEAPRSPTSTLSGLDELVERTSSAGLTISTEIGGKPRPLPTAVDLAAYRIVQESLTNVVRHAAARRAVIRLDYGADELVVRVDDDGRGGAVDHDDAGSGVLGMRERTSTLGGSVAFAPSPLGGLRVTAVLPIRERP